MDIDKSIQHTEIQKQQLLNLPAELVIQILANTHWSDYYALCRTSTRLRELANVQNSLSSARYGPLPLPSTKGRAPTDFHFRIHQLFFYASYRNGAPYYMIATLGSSAKASINARRFLVETSSFREDSFSDPKCDKVVISWAYVDVSEQFNCESAALSGASLSLVPHHGALYINNLIVGTGSGKRPLDSRAIAVLDPADDEMPDISGDSETQLSYITIRDVFEAFERDHPQLKHKKGGEAKIVGFHHVFHPSVGARGGSHFEVQWTWVDDA